MGIILILLTFDDQASIFILLLRLGEIVTSLYKISHTTYSDMPRGVIKASAFDCTFNLPCKTFLWDFCLVWCVSNEAVKPTFQIYLKNFLSFGQPRQFLSALKVVLGWSGKYVTTLSKNCRKCHTNEKMTFASPRDVGVLQQVLCSL